jgi:hypothetical protein
MATRLKFEIHPKTIPLYMGLTPFLFHQRPFFIAPETSQITVKTNTSHQYGLSFALAIVHTKRNWLISTAVRQLNKVSLSISHLYVI